MVSARDILFLGALGAVVFLITRAGRDLFGALPSLGAGVNNFTSDVSSGFGSFADSIGSGFAGIQDAFGSLFEQNEIIIGQITDRPVPPELVPTEDERLEGNQFIRDRLGLGGIDARRVQEDEILTPEGPFLPPERPLNLLQLASSEPVQISIPENPQSLIPVQSEIEDQQFFGGGDSFIGGVVRETPITGDSSLSDIIERFDVSATEASDIRARLADDFGGFDFGSNTGRGIGSVFEREDIRTQIGQPESAVSDPIFAGQSAEEIALRLTGGNISNF